MPADYQIDTSLGVVFSKAWGVLTDEDLLAHREALSRDPDFSPSHSQIYDFSGVTKFEVTPNVVRALGGRSIFSQGSREALVMSSDLGYGFARMFQTLSTNTQRNVMVFQDIAEAYNWLGLAAQSSQKNG